MSDPINFFIDGRPYTSANSTVPGEGLLAIAGLSTDQVVLVAADGTRITDPHEDIEVHPGDRFTTEPVDGDSHAQLPIEIKYKVNGEPQTTIETRLSVRQILQDAGKAASIDVNQLDSYILENIGTGSKYENLNDIVIISNDDHFLAVHSGKTPVAVVSYQ